MKFSLKPK